MTGIGTCRHNELGDDPGCASNYDEYGCNAATTMPYGGISKPVEACVWRAQSSRRLQDALSGPLCQETIQGGPMPKRAVRSIGCRWKEIEENTWIIPAGRMKSRREHRVPLPAAALDLLRELQSTNNTSELVFSADGRSLSNMAMLQLLRRMEPGKTVHGFRSSFRIWAVG